MHRALGLWTRPSTADSSSTGTVRPRSSRESRKVHTTILHCVLGVVFCPQVIEVFLQQRLERRGRSG